MLLHIPNPWVHLSGRLLELILPFHEIHMRINGFTTNMNACSEACGLPRHLGQCKDLEATGSSPHWIYQALHISTERDFYCHCYFYLVVRNYLFSLRNVNYITRCCRCFCFVFANEQVPMWLNQTELAFAFVVMIGLQRYCKLIGNWTFTHHDSLWVVEFLI